LNEDELDLARKNLARRSKREPWQYIRGYVDFYDCEILVNSHVLIPRQETEILVDMICKSLEKDGDLEGKSFWDVCTGSGCIGIAIKKKFPALNVTLSDVSSDALKMAKINAEKNGVTVNFLQGDLLKPFSGRQTNYLVCNPPYIRDDEYNKLETEVKDYEPIQALISGPTGLEFYEALSLELKDVILPRGKAWFEMGTGQGVKIFDMFKDASWTNLKVQKDWSQHDRFFLLENE
jgi:release factor glutamine methyltransferase